MAVCMAIVDEEENPSSAYKEQTINLRLLP